MSNVNVCPLIRLEAKLAELESEGDPDDEGAVDEAVATRARLRMLPNKITRLRKQIEEAHAKFPPLVDKVADELDMLHGRILGALLRNPMAALKSFVADEAERREIAMKTDALKEEATRQSHIFHEVRRNFYSQRGGQLGATALERLAETRDVLERVGQKTSFHGEPSAS